MRRGLFLWCILFAPLLLAADIDIGEYKYYRREVLANNLEKIYRKHREKYGDRPLKVKVVDEFVKVWKRQNLEGGWVRFDTKYFRCIIQRTNAGTDRATGFPHSYSLLRKIQQYRRKRAGLEKSKKILQDPKKRWLHYGLIAIYGRIVKSDKWGPPISEEARENGVEPDYFILEVDRIVVPRTRFYKLYYQK